MRIRISCEGSVNLPLDSLKIFQDSENQTLKELSQESYVKLKNEILSEGFSFPFFVWKDGVNNWILDGTHRKKVLCKMREEGYEVPELPCAIVKANNEKEAARKLLAVTSQYAKITDQGLYEFMDKFDIEMNEIKDRFEFSDIDLDAFEDNFFTEVETLPEGEEDSVPEITHDPITKRGDVWFLGEHRLMCGDSTMIDDVEKLMNGEKADIIFTDPPYGISVVSNNGTIGSGGDYKANQYKPIIGDDQRFDVSFIKEFFDCDMILWGANYFCHDLPETNSWLIWQKIKSSLAFSDGEMAYSSIKTPLRIYEHIWAGGMRSGDKKTELKNRIHPTQKPVGLFVEIFKDILKDKYKNVVDLFLGSGSTIIACEKTDRKCLGMELLEDYCDVIINRWQNYTGKKAKLETGEYYNDLLDARQ